MSAKASKRIQYAASAIIFSALSANAGCGNSEPEPTQVRSVQGALNANSLAMLDAPRIVAQDGTGQTFDAPITSDGTFTVNVPANENYRLFVTDTRATGRLSAETRVLWPGNLAWANIPASDTNAPIALGTIVPGAGGTTSDGVAISGAGTGAAPGANGQIAGGAPAGAGSTTTGGGAIGGSGAPTGGSTGGSGGSGSGEGSSEHSGSGGGEGSGSGESSAGSGSGDSPAAVGATSDGNPGGGFGFTGGSTSSGNFGSKSPSNHGRALCVPSKTSVGVATGSATGIKKCGSKVTEPTIPACVAGGTNADGQPQGTVSNIPTVGTPPGASTPAARCESDKVAVFDQEKNRWDCVKMETPVTYFYSEKPIKVRASVEFPRGTLSQWYPGVVDTFPFVAGQSKMDDSAKAKTCGLTFGALEGKNGLLDWGTLDLLGRDANIDAKLPQADLDRYTWSFARQVAANPVRTSNGQLEKFLFYRGIGNFSLPVKVTAQREGQLSLANIIDDSIGHVYFLNVTDKVGTFTKAGGGIAPGQKLQGAIPSLANAKDVNAYADDLAKAVRTSLDENGLYDDEATAMVNTWKRQWFRTPGPRLLYIAPQSWTDRSIPLNVDPKPEATKRVMVIRVELLTPEIESEDVAALRKLMTASTAPEAKAHFTALGRFAEPRLRRAMALAGQPAYAQPLLAEVMESNHTTHKPTAGTKPLTPDPKGPRYSGKGFVVHEWGTDTIVVGSDGSQLLGLQHEEEDLPKFVYDRRH